MKKFIRLTALTLVLVMLFSTVAFAEEVDKGKELGSYEITCYNGATVSFVAVDDNDQIKVTYKDENAIQEGGLYLVLMVDGDGTAASITDGKIQYIDQTVGSEDHSITFYVYPEKLAAGTILITGTGLSGTQVGTDEDGNSIYAVGLIAAIVKGKFMLGDLNGDKTVTTQDVVVFRQYFAEIITLEDFDKSAADINKDGVVTTQDLVILNQYFAEIIDALE